MKASKLIQILAQGIEDFGDLDVGVISSSKNKETDNYDYSKIKHDDVFVTEIENTDQKEFFIRF